MKTYNWQQADWPHFRYDLSGVQEVLLAIVEKSGFISGQLTHLDESLQTEAMVTLMVEEALKTSEIEGEYLSRPDLRSSIKNKLGLNPQQVPVKDKRVQGVVDLMFDVRQTYTHVLTAEKLLDWHLLLLSGSFNPDLKVGSWRLGPEPMQVVSGHHGKWVVHYEAPPAASVPEEMEKFIRWFNSTAPGQTKMISFAPVRAAIAHLYFESIHPFDDGNGRIGRAIAEKALSQGFGYPVLLSLSTAIEADKNAYYAALQAGSRSNEITPWIHYFVEVILRAQKDLEAQIHFILKKTELLDRYQDVLNERQFKVIRRMLEAGIKGFEGGMSAKKYMSIADTSKATATRDLQHLLTLGILRQIGGGRSAHYELNFR